MCLTLTNVYIDTYVITDLMFDYLYGLFCMYIYYISNLTGFDYPMYYMEMPFCYMNYDPNLWP